MGGVWGLASSTALENLPVEARGLASGVLQQGYAFGYLIAAVINLRLVPHTSTTWRTLFWASSGISAFAALIRALVPESEVFLRAKALERETGSTTGKKTRRFIRQAGDMLKKHWLLCIYAVLLMTGTWTCCARSRVGWLTCVCGLGFNFFSHGSQDLYPTYLQTTKGFDSYHSTVATIIGNCGAIAYVSELTPIIPFAYHYVYFPFLCQQRWRNRGFRVTVHRSSSHHHHLCFDCGRIHPFVDSTQIIQWTFCWRILAAVWCAGCMGCHPDPTCRDEPTRVPRDVPGCYLPTRKCTVTHTHHLRLLADYDLQRDR